MRRILARGAEEIRQLTGDDLAQIKRLLQTSEYVYQRFTPEELPTLLAYYPALGAFYGSSLHGFILSQTVNAPSAWIGGFCVSWTECQSSATSSTCWIDITATSCASPTIHPPAGKGSVYASWPKPSASLSMLARLASCSTRRMTTFAPIDFTSGSGSYAFSRKGSY